MIAFELRTSVITWDSEPAPAVYNYDILTPIIHPNHPTAGEFNGVDVSLEIKQEPGIEPIIRVDLNGNNNNHEIRFCWGKKTAALMTLLCDDGEAWEECQTIDATWLQDVLQPVVKDAVERLLG